jgi:methylphosphotriester-DNA--protein-cysteine methyltransferase
MLNMNLKPSEQLWQAVVAKDARFDGQFVFAVTSTGVTAVLHALHAVRIANV